MRAFPVLVIMLLKMWLRSRTALFFGLAFPVILLLVFGTIFGSPSQPNYTLYVRNLDVHKNGTAGFLSKAFIEALNDSVFEIKLLRPDEPIPRSTGFAPIRVLTIPANFTNNLVNASIRKSIGITINTIKTFIEMAGESLPEAVRANVSEGIKGMEAFKETIRAGNTAIVLEGSPDDRILQPIEGIINVIASKFELALLNATPIVTVKTYHTEGRQLKAVDYYLPGYIAAFIMTNGLIGVSQMVSELRRRGVVKLLASTPVSKSFWIAAVVVSQTIVSLLLTAVMLVVGWIVFEITVFPDLFSLLIIFAGTLSFTGLGVLIAGVLKEAEAVAALGNMVSYPMMFLSGAFWPLDLMPLFLQEVAKFMPLYYFHVALRDALVVGSPATALIPAAITTAIAVAAMVSAVIATKWRDF